MADNNANGEGNGAADRVGGRSRHDNTRLQDILTTLFSLQSGVSPQPMASSDSVPTVSLRGITMQDLARLMGSGPRVTPPDEDEADEANEDVMMFEGGNDDDEYDDDDDDYYYSPPPRPARQWFKPVEEPQQAGLELLTSGEFGQVGIKNRSRRRATNLARTVLDRGYRPIPSPNREELCSNLVPNTNGVTVATYDSNMYTASFSNDSSFYYTCAQDFKLHIFDMKAPPTADPVSRIERVPRGSRRIRTETTSLVTRMPLRKVIQGHPGRWTITDANLSPDNERMIYSTIAPTVYMTSTAPDGNATQIPIPFADPLPRISPRFDYSEGFGIWSCRFSADGNEVVAGGSGKIFVYDLLANRRTVKIAAHTDDVNSCCWADTGSGNILVSASDDTFLKVWDRRSLGASHKPSGVLIGHTEGITYVSAKGDGRYIISNGKDQALRLWDLRKMRTSAEHEAVEKYHYGVDNFDYRYPNYPKPRYQAHPKDCSVMTYRGHAVLRTLIRCHFSPAETTGSQYIYSGSADGRIHIWSLDGRVVQVLDRSRTLPAGFSPSGPVPPPANGLQSNYCVRDVSWHTQEPVILSAGWENGTVIARHEYKGLSKTSGALQDWVEKNRLESNHYSGVRRSTRLRQLARRRHVPGAFHQDDEEDD
ncbi:unnamed protein product [Cyclocybe aegerita]|uniref:WD40 repeat-like protein n=1 Tax=Cyclocybe aegerita TaxID=1973307 RepID=A0A8S0W6I9_CYCAE|nr:unnamed protein product [Cyclocybe aegerita]